MTNSKKIIASVLVLAILTALFAPLVAADPNVGVTAGQWVKYGDFTASGTGIATSLTNQTDWIEVSVVSVSGTNVTLTVSGQYKNGTAVTVGGMTLNVTTGASNSSTGDFVFIIPANLQQGEAIPLPGLDFAVTVTKVESENLMGVNRNVCVFNYSISALGMSYEYLMTWDQASGMLMKVNLAGTSPYENMTLSFNAIDTNVFTTGVAGTLMDNLIYIVIAVVVILVIVVAALTLLRRRKPEAQAAPPAEAPSTTEAPAPT